MIFRFTRKAIDIVMSFWLYIVLYATAIALYGLWFLPFPPNAFTLPNILIAPIMTLGSFVAGSTFLGGGAVAFPAMTKWLMMSPLLAKQFALAIQSVGMTSASLLIIYKLKKIPWDIYCCYLPGSMIGATISITFLQYIIASPDIKIGFTLFIVCFYIIFIYSRKKNYHLEEVLLDYEGKLILLGAGFIGGLASGLIGSGADLILFCILNLYFRLNFKTATLLSVIAMAMTSLFSIVLVATTSVIEMLIVDLWVIAAPIVVIGAPLGAWVCIKISEKKLFWFVSVIVLVEIVTSLVLVPIESSKIKYFALLLISYLILFRYLLKMSRVRHL